MAGLRVKITNLIKSFKGLSDHTKLTLLITFLVGTGFFLEWTKRFGNFFIDIDSPRVLVARHDLAKGRVLGQYDLTTVSASEEEAEKYLTDQQLPFVLTAKTRNAMRRGERISYDVLELSGKAKGLADAIPVGFRAYSFVPGNDIPLQIGNRVDLLGTIDSISSPTRRVASAVEVLDLKHYGGKTTMVVAVSPDDLVGLEKVRQMGKIIVALRNSKDSKTSEGSKVGFGKGSHIHMPKKVEILVEEAK